MRIKLIFISVLLFWGLRLSAQGNLQDSLKGQLSNTFGLERLKTLNQLTLFNIQGLNKDRFKYGRRGLELAETLLEGKDAEEFTTFVPFIEAYYFAAKLDYEKERYLNAKLNFEQAIALNHAFESEFFLQDCETYLDSIQAMLNREEIKEGKILNRLSELKVRKLIKNTSLGTQIKAEVKLGQSKEKAGNIGGAINNYKEAINLSRNKGDFSRVNELQLKVSELLQELNQEEAAQKFLEEAILEQEEIDMPNQLDTLSSSLEELKTFADSLARTNNSKQSDLYYELYHELNFRLKQDSAQSEQQAIQKQKEIRLLKQQKEIADLMVDSSRKAKQKEEEQKQIIFLIACLIAIASLTIYYLYRAKKKEHKQLNQTYKTLKETKEDLEEAEQKIVKLLKQQVSQDIADKLLVDPSEKNAERHFVAVLFLDIRNFTVRAEKMSPEELIDFQNSVFGFMIDCIESKYGNINQLLGDGFMATFGAPRSHGNDCQNAFEAAQNILKELAHQIAEGKLPKIRVGIGLHAGYIVSGNVGSKNRMQYSITGNPVIIASRIEQLNKQFESQFILSKEVYEMLDAEVQEKLLADFQEVSLKGRSEPTQILIVE